jgi:uncharacterized membrane protein YjgN (DUF898 family)
MNDVNDPAVSVAAAPGARATAAQSPYRLAMRFGGSGSEYFRIWIVNLLLIVVTLGLYYPFAKVRRLRYFYGNTTLAGDEFDFHGNPWKMLRGFVLMAALTGSYALATKVSPWAALVALLLMAAIWPVLFRASMQFRLANTSWRGLRFEFHGNTAGAYRALVPAQVALLLYLGGVAFLGDASQASHGAASGRSAPAAAGIAMGLGALLLMLLSPWFWWSIKRYQHGHYGIGPLRTELRSGPGAFYAVFLKALGIALLLILPVIGLFFAVMVARSGNVLVLSAAVMFVYLAMIVVVGSFLVARLQNLVWSRTRGRGLRFDSRVPLAGLVRLTIKNWLLIALTLGLYLPFARVTRARLLVEAITVTTAHPPAALTAALRGMGGDAAGDASGDLLGLDIGL